MNFIKSCIAGIAALGIMMGVVAQPAAAQSGRYYNDNYNWVTPSWRAPKYKKRYNSNRGYNSNQYYGKTKKYPEVMSGGPRPYISPKRPKVVKFRKKYKNGSIVIDTKRRKLYYVLGKGRAYSYPIAVGKRGFAWTGTSKISAKKNWPDWRPPAEMRKRKPNLPKLMHGGLNNPLGAKAL
ncbi:MAG: L,D-transpeptidase, partial [Pseudomonadota bacterium]